MVEITLHNDNGIQSNSKVRIITAEKTSNGYVKRTFGDSFAFRSSNSIEESIEMIQLDKVPSSETKGIVEFSDHDPNKDNIEFVPMTTFSRTISNCSDDDKLESSNFLNERGNKLTVMSFIDTVLLKL